MKSRQPMHILKFAFPAIAFVVMQLISPAQSALQKKHEDELAQAEHRLKTVFNDASATDAQKAAVLRGKGASLAILGKNEESISILRQAVALAPDDLPVQLSLAVSLDRAGAHQQAREKFDRLFEKLEAWHANRMAALKASEKPDANASDTNNIFVGLALPQRSAINHVFLNNYAKASAQFNRDYETNIRSFGANDASNYDACWLIWLTAKGRAADGMRADVAIERLTGTLVVGSPYHQEMLKLWRGKGGWQGILAAINGMNISDAEKENYLTEAHFFAAGYYRYLKNDNQTALELLDAENARPFNGCVERLFISREIAGLRGLEQK